MQSRSVARELALLMLGQVSDRQPSADTSLDTLLQQALASLSQHTFARPWIRLRLNCRLSNSCCWAACSSVAA